MPPTDLRPLAEQLLDQLSGEEDLLRQARECVMGLYASLRKGDVPAVQAALPRNEALASRLYSQSEQRQVAAARLAVAVGLPPNCSLQSIASQTPEPFAGRLLAARNTLRGLAAQVDQYRYLNANLIDRLRSFFQDVLSGLTTPDAPARYGPSGARLTAPAVSATVVSG